MKAAQQGALDVDPIERLLDNIPHRHFAELVLTVDDADRVARIMRANAHRCLLTDMRNEYPTTAMRVSPPVHIY